MKKVILILGTILLGVWIVSSLFMSDTGLQGSAQKTTTEGVAKIDKIIRDY
jgi:hypothetical protein